MNSTYPIILLVDDDTDLLDTYEEALKIKDVMTLKARSGSEAYELCKIHKNIQVIISDSNMGEMSGMALLLKLRSHYETMPIFYLLTGSYDITQAEVINAGGHDLILKPFDLDEILERIKKDIKF